MKYSGMAIIITSLIAIIALGGCGGEGGGGGDQSNEVTSTINGATYFNSCSVSGDEYGLQNATFLSATNNNGLFVMRAAIAKGMADPDFRTVFRMDVLQPQLIRSSGTYAVGGADSPVEILFFNGHRSTLLNTVSGSIYFSSYGVNSGNVVAGSFSVLVEDHNCDVPRPTYTIRVSFRFVVNSYGAVVPTPTPIPDSATDYYDTKCGSCHTLGSHDTSSSGDAPDLAGKGWEIPNHLDGHGSVITLSEEDIHGLKVLLNAY